MFVKLNLQCTGALTICRNYYGFFFFGKGGGIERDNTERIEKGRELEAERDKREREREKERDRQRDKERKRRERLRKEERNRG